MNENVPSWYMVAIKAIRWLELRREKGDDAFYSAYAISVNARIPLDVVNQMISEAGELLQHKGGRYRFNTMVRIQAALDEAVASGLLEKVGEKYALTKLGELMGQNAIMTNPDAADLYKRLMKKGGKK